MFEVSKNTLRILAALVWFSGIVVLFFKALSLIVEAESINSESIWIWLVVVFGVIIGLLKAKYLFSKACKKNLKRIESLHRPKLWQFYRIPFFIFLLSMVSLGSYLSKLAAEDFAFLLSVAFVDISVGTALFFSSHYFWKK